MVVRRQAISKVGGFRGSFVQLSDFDLCVRLAAVGGLHIVGDALTRMRIISPDAAGDTAADSRAGTRPNLSMPNPCSHNRSTIEFAEILGRYVTPSMISLLPAIFPDRIPEVSQPDHLWKCGLARHAWALGSPAHYLFADRVVAGILERDDTRRDAVNAFGAELVSEFIERRGRLSVEVASPLKPAHFK
jgi:hypothetical protein